MVGKATNLINYVTKDDKAADFMHSSAYAKSQSGNSFGAAAGDTFAERQAIEEKRKYVQKYGNSRIANSFYGIQRARTTIPRTGANAGTTSGGQTSSRSAFGQRSERSRVANPMDTAMRRASTTATNSHAPVVPNRRSGISR